MDRLVCGDVGYGKTEVAIRAAFKAVQDGKQVAVLVPTTILAQQHLSTFRERFAGFPGGRRDAVAAARTQGGHAPSWSDWRAASSTSSSARTGCCRRTCTSRRSASLVVDEEHRFGVGAQGETQAR